MIIETLKKLLTRDLTALTTEIRKYQKEENLWLVEGAIANSAGNLCLHIIGNLNTYIGKEIGQTGYVRNRTLEFAQQQVPRSLLLEKIDETILVVNRSLDMLDEADLAKEYPELVFAEKTDTTFLLVHLATHLSYHLGQVNYHRRLVDR